jgi:23S rRNA (adenine2503-C2)-methyltransferase
LEKRNILDLNIEELKQYITQHRYPAYRATQVYQWAHKGLYDFGQMINLPVSLRSLLSADFYTGLPSIEKRYVSDTDGTVKYLFRLYDDSLIESVLLNYSHGKTACISSQVGCRMGCGFCASTTGGLVRHLSAGEMVAQVIAIQRDCSHRISNIVVMGSGEPLDNYHNTIKFISQVSNQKGLNIGLRHITISTCGPVPEILRLADSRLPVTLSVSLHASDDKTRKQLMPIAKKYKIEDVIDACREYIIKTGRRVTFEYALIDGINDGAENARRLAGLLSGMLCHVNIIPVNPVKGKPYRQPSRAQIYAFRDSLLASGITATVRRELGRDISGACGQLKAGYLEDQLK